MESNKNVLDQLRVAARHLRPMKVFTLSGDFIGVPVTVDERVAILSSFTVDKFGPAKEIRLDDAKLTLDPASITAVTTSSMLRIAEW